MARYKFPLTKRDKFAVFGEDFKGLEELDDQEYYIKGAIYRPSAAQNTDGTVQLQPVNIEKKKTAIPPDIYKRFFASQPHYSETSNDDLSFEGASRYKDVNSPLGSGTPDNRSGIVSVSGSTQQPLLPPQTDPNLPPLPLNNTLNTIPEEKTPYPEDFVIKFYASLTDMIWVAFCFIVYLVHISCNIWLAVLYILKEEYLWFGLTAAFILVPAFIMSAFSLHLYIKDWRIVGEKTVFYRWIIRAVFLLLPLAPLLRLVDTFLFGLRSRMTKDTEKQKTLYDRMIDEEVDCTIIRLIEAFLHAAPQTVLQLYILTQIGLEKGPIILSVQIAVITLSLITVSSLLVGLSKTMRLSQPDKALLTRPGMIVMFLWRILEVSARCLALAMFASKFSYFVAVPIAVHWVAMVIWVFQQKTKYCMLVTKEGKENHSKCWEIFFRLSLAFIKIFCFVNVIEGHTRLRQLVYYVLMFAENLTLTLAFYVAAAVQGTPLWYDETATMYVNIGLASAIILQVFYYKCCHPNNYSVMHDDQRIQWCIKWNDVSMCYDLGVLNLDALDANETLGEREEELDTSKQERNPLNLKSALKKRPLPPPPTQYLRRGGSKRSSASSSDSVRSNFEHKTEMDSDTKQKLNLSYHQPQKLEDLIKGGEQPPQGPGATTV